MPWSTKEKRLSLGETDSAFFLMYFRNLVPYPHLVKWLDHAQENRFAWISGPRDYGKTEAAVSIVVRELIYNPGAKIAFVAGVGSSARRRADKILQATQSASWELDVDYSPEAVNCVARGYELDGDTKYDLIVLDDVVATRRSHIAQRALGRGEEEAVLKALAPTGRVVGFGPMCLVSGCVHRVDPAFTGPVPKHTLHHGVAEDGRPVIERVELHEHPTTLAPDLRSVDYLLKQRYYTGTKMFDEEYMLVAQQWTE